MKAATCCAFAPPNSWWISIHAAREGGDAKYNCLQIYFDISIHAAREGGDVDEKEIPEDKAISIHAAREGGDPLAFKLRVRLEISIHAAREGGDRTVDDLGRICIPFQSTPPVKAATLFSIFAFTGSEISIHAAREGGDHTR